MLYVLWTTKQKSPIIYSSRNGTLKSAVSMGTGEAVHSCISFTGLDDFHICVVLFYATEKEVLTHEDTR
jgi:hypothetical protein